jgi:sugar O-acyltransferase (sialic acid O-acetyltransferase NeuD family)
MDVVFGLFGTGGYGRETMAFVRSALARNELLRSKNVTIVFVDRPPAPSNVNGYQVIPEEEFFKLPGQRYYNVAVADGKLRQRVSEKCLENGTVPLPLFAENATFGDANEIGEGAIFSPFSSVTSNAKIGRFFHCNIYSYVAHDCTVGDFVTFAPGVKCNGNIVIEDYAYIGTGVVIRQGQAGAPLRIGSGATVGMGAVITKNVAAGTTVVGNPARILERKH